MSATIFTKVGILTIDMTWNHSGYVSITLGRLQLSWTSILLGLIFSVCLSGKEEGLLVALYSYQAFEGIHSKAFTWGRWSYFSGEDHKWSIDHNKWFYNNSILSLSGALIKSPLLSFLVEQHFCYQFPMKQLYFLTFTDSRLCISKGSLPPFFWPWLIYLYVLCCK